MTKFRTIPAHLEDAAPLALWLDAYPCIRQNPAAWLKGYNPTPADVRRFPELFDGDELRTNCAVAIQRKDCTMKCDRQLKESPRAKPHDEMRFSFRREKCVTVSKLSE